MSDMSDEGGLLRKLNLRKNVSFAVGEFAVNTLLLFVGYRLLIKQSGIEALGVWSTLYAWTNLIRLADAGVSGAATRFLAQWDLEQEQSKIRIYGETALLTNVAQFGVLSLVAYFAISPFVASMTGASHAAQGAQVLPWMLLLFFLLNVAGTVLGMLQGLHLGYQRSQLSMLGTVIQLVLVLWLVPSFGLLGLAWAQISQYLVVLILGWVQLRFKLGTGWLPSIFDMHAFKEMLGYSLKAQLVNISNGLIEPISKMLVGNFGGMAAQGYYELAFKTVLLPRNLIATGVSATIPTLARLSQGDTGMLRVMYSRAFRVSASLMGLAVILIIALAPVSSQLWLGETNKTYWLYTSLLAFGFFGNMLGMPAYIVAMATGHMYRMIVVTLTTLGLLIVVGFSIGEFVSGTGIVALNATAIGCCGIAVWLTNRKLVTR